MRLFVPVDQFPPFPCVHARGGPPGGDVPIHRLQQPLVRRYSESVEADPLEDPHPQDGRERGERFSREDDGDRFRRQCPSTRHVHIPADPPARLGIEVVVELAEPLAQCEDPILDGFPVPLFEKREKDVAHPVPFEPGVDVRPVDPIRYPAFLQVFEDILFPDIENRPDDPVFRRSRDPFQPPDPRPLEEAHQDRLDLVVRRVGQRDRLRPHVSRELPKEPVPDLPGLLLEPGREIPAGS